MSQGAPNPAIFTNGIWKENPVLVTTLGLCPTLAVTNSVANSLVMGLGTMFVLLASSFLVSSVRKVVPRNRSGKTVLRVLDRKGEVLARTTVRVIRRQAA